MCLADRQAESNVAEAIIERMSVTILPASFSLVLLARMGLGRLLACVWARCEVSERLSYVLLSFVCRPHLMRRYTHMQSKFSPLLQLPFGFCRLVYAHLQACLSVLMHRSHSPCMLVLHMHTSLPAHAHTTDSSLFPQHQRRRECTLVYRCGRSLCHCQQRALDGECVAV